MSCLWCCGEDGQVEYYLRILSQEVTTDEGFAFWANKCLPDLFYCTQCTQCYHEGKKNFINKESSLKTLCEIEQERVMDHLRKLKPEIEKNEELSTNPFLEVLDYPYLCLSEPLVQLFVDELETLLRVMKCKTIVEMGVAYKTWFLLLFSKSQVVKHWAAECISGMDLIDTEQFFGYQPMMSAIIAALFPESPACTSKYRFTATHKLPRHLYNDVTPANLWLVCGIIFRCLDSRALKTFLSENASQNLLQLISRKLHDQTVDLLAILSVLEILLKKLGSTFWLLIDDEQSENLFDVITKHQKYEDLLKLLSKKKHEENGGSAVNKRKGFASILYSSPTLEEQATQMFSWILPLFKTVSELESVHFKLITRIVNFYHNILELEESTSMLHSFTSRNACSIITYVFTLKHLWLLNCPNAANVLVTLLPQHVAELGTLVKDAVTCAVGLRQITPQKALVYNSNFKKMKRKHPYSIEVLKETLHLIFEKSVPVKNEPTEEENLIYVQSNFNTSTGGIGEPIIIEDDDFIKQEEMEDAYHPLDGSQSPIYISEDEEHENDKTNKDIDFCRTSGDVSKTLMKTTEEKENEAEEEFVRLIGSKKRPAVDEYVASKKAKKSQPSDQVKPSNNADSVTTPNKPKTLELFAQFKNKLDEKRKSPIGALPKSKSVVLKSGDSNATEANDSTNGSLEASEDMPPSPEFFPSVKPTNEKNTQLPSLTIESKSAKSVKKPIEKPVQKPVEKQAEKQLEKPIAKAMEKPVAKPAKKAVVTTEPPPTVVKRPRKMLKLPEMETKKAFTPAYFIQCVLLWEVDWFVNNTPENGPPSHFIKTDGVNFESYDDYAKTFWSLLLAETHSLVQKDWNEGNNQTFDYVIQNVEEHTTVYKSFQILCSFASYDDDTTNVFPPVREDLVVLKFDEKVRVFGVVEDYNRTPHKTSNGRQTVFCLRIKVLELPVIKIYKKVSVQKISSLTSTLRQFSALIGIRTSPIGGDILKPFRNRTYTINESLIPRTDNLKKLNASQYRAVSTVTNAVLTEPGIPRIALLQGPPGTGKSYTVKIIIAHLITELHKQQEAATSSAKLADKKRILICAPSNCAVDEIARRLTSSPPRIDDSTSVKKNENNKNCGNFNLIRIGRETSIELRNHMLETIVHKEIERRGLTNNKNTLNQKIALMNQALDNLDKVCSKLKAMAMANPSRKKEFLDKMNERKQYQKRMDQLVRQRNTKIDVRVEEEKIRRQTLWNADIVCCTLNCAGSFVMVDAFKRNRMNKAQPFQCVVIDEAGQCTEPDALIPLQYGVSKLVLVGDPAQLPATVLSKRAERYHYGQSLFERIYNALVINNQLTEKEIPVIMLNYQYRMAPAICSFPAQRFYGGRLQSSNGTQNNGAASHLRNYAVVNVADGKEANSNGGAIHNPMEREHIVVICKTIVTQNSASQYDICIITPYRKQMTQLRHDLNAANLNAVTVETIDGYQGRERRIIILSCVRGSANSGRIGFLSNPQRMNVALTRAKDHLFVIANCDFIECDDDWKALVDDAKERKLFFNSTCVEETAKFIFKEKFLPTALLRVQSTKYSGEDGGGGSDGNRTSKQGKTSSSYLALNNAPPPLFNFKQSMTNCHRYSNKKQVNDQSAATDDTHCDFVKTATCVNASNNESNVASILPVTTESANPVIKTFSNSVTKASECATTVVNTVPVITKPPVDMQTSALNTTTPQPSSTVKVNTAQPTHMIVDAASNVETPSYINVFRELSGAAVQTEATDQPASSTASGVTTTVTTKSAIIEHPESTSKVCKTSVAQVSNLNSKVTDKSLIKSNVISEQLTSNISNYTTSAKKSEPTSSSSSVTVANDSISSGDSNVKGDSVVKSSIAHKPLKTSTLPVITSVTAPVLASALLSKLIHTSTSESSTARKAVPKVAIRKVNASTVNTTTIALSKLTSITCETISSICKQSSTANFKGLTFSSKTSMPETAEPKKTNDAHDKTTERKSKKKLERKPSNPKTDQQKKKQATKAIPEQQAMKATSDQKATKATTDPHFQKQTASAKKDQQAKNLNTAIDQKSKKQSPTTSSTFLMAKATLLLNKEVVQRITAVPSVHVLNELQVPAKVHHTHSLISKKRRISHLSTHVSQASETVLPSETPVSSNDHSKRLSMDNLGKSVSSTKVTPKPRTELATNTTRISNPKKIKNNLSNLPPSSSTQATKNLYSKQNKPVSKDENRNSKEEHVLNKAIKKTKSKVTSTFLTQPLKSPPTYSRSNSLPGLSTTLSLTTKSPSLSMQSTTITSAISSFTTKSRLVIAHSSPPCATTSNKSQASAVSDSTVPSSIPPKQNVSLNPNPTPVSKNFLSNTVHSAHVEKQVGCNKNLSIVASVAGVTANMVSSVANPNFTVNKDPAQVYLKEMVTVTTIVKDASATQTCPNPVESSSSNDVANVLSESMRNKNENSNKNERQGKSNNFLNKNENIINLTTVYSEITEPNVKVKIEPGLDDSFEIPYEKHTSTKILTLTDQSQQLRVSSGFTQFHLVENVTRPGVARSPVEFTSSNPFQTTSETNKEPSDASIGKDTHTNKTNDASASGGPKSVTQTRQNCDFLRKPTEDVPELNEDQSASNKTKTPPAAVTPAVVPTGDVAIDISIKLLRKRLNEATDEAVKENLLSALKNLEMVAVSNDLSLPKPTDNLTKSSELVPMEQLSQSAKTHKNRQSPIVKSPEPRKKQQSHVESLSKTMHAFKVNEPPLTARLQKQTSRSSEDALLEVSSPCNSAASFESDNVFEGGWAAHHRANTKKIKYGSTGNTSLDSTNNDMYERRLKPSASYFKLPHRHNDGTHCVTECVRMLEREKRREAYLAANHRITCDPNIPWQLIKITFPESLRNRAHLDKKSQQNDPRLQPRKHKLARLILDPEPVTGFQGFMPNTTPKMKPLYTPLSPSPVYSDISDVEDRDTGKTKTVIKEEPIDDTAMSSIFLFPEFQASIPEPPKKRSLSRQNSKGGSNETPEPPQPPSSYSSQQISNEALNAPNMAQQIDKLPPTKPNSFPPLPKNTPLPPSGTLPPPPIEPPPPPIEPPMPPTSTHHDDMDICDLPKSNILLSPPATHEQLNEQLPPMSDLSHDEVQSYPSSANYPPEASVDYPSSSVPPVYPPVDFFNNPPSYSDPYQAPPANFTPYPSNDAYNNDPTEKSYSNQPGYYGETYERYRDEAHYDQHLYEYNNQARANYNSQYYDDRSVDLRTQTIQDGRFSANYDYQQLDTLNRSRNKDNEYLPLIEREVFLSRKSQDIPPPLMDLPRPRVSRIDVSENRQQLVQSNPIVEGDNDVLMKSLEKEILKAIDPNIRIEDKEILVSVATDYFKRKLNSKVKSPLLPLEDNFSFSMEKILTNAKTSLESAVDDPSTQAMTNTEKELESSKRQKMIKDIENCIKILKTPDKSSTKKDECRYVDPFPQRGDGVVGIAKETAGERTRNLETRAVKTKNPCDSYSDVPVSQILNENHSKWKAVPKAAKENSRERNRLVCGNTRGESKDQYRDSKGYPQKSKHITKTGVKSEEAQNLSEIPKKSSFHTDETSTESKNTYQSITDELPKDASRVEPLESTYLTEKNTSRSSAEPVPKKSSDSTIYSSDAKTLTNELESPPIKASKMSHEYFVPRSDRKSTSKDCRYIDFDTSTTSNMVEVEKTRIMSPADGEQADGFALKEVFKKIGSQDDMTLESLIASTKKLKSTEECDSYQIKECRVLVDDILKKKSEEPSAASIRPMEITGNVQEEREECKEKQTIKRPFVQRSRMLRTSDPKALEKIPRGKLKQPENINKEISTPGSTKKTTTTAPPPKRKVIVTSPIAKPLVADSSIKPSVFSGLAEKKTSFHIDFHERLEHVKSEGRYHIKSWESSPSGSKESSSTRSKDDSKYDRSYYKTDDQRHDYHRYSPYDKDERRYRR